MKWYIGCDPGLKGGLALITGDGAAIEYDRMPGEPKGIYNFISDALIAADGKATIILEAGGGGGGTVGAFAAKSAGLYLGYFRMIGAAFSIPVVEVHPARWKVKMGVKSDKNTSIRMAEQLFPTVNLLFPRCTVKADGVAEALLIAEYGRRNNL